MQKSMFLSSSAVCSSVSIHLRPCKPENVLEAQLSKTAVVEHGTSTASKYSCIAK